MIDLMVYADADGKCALKEEGKEPRVFTDILQVIDYLNMEKAKKGAEIELTLYGPMGDSMFRDWLM